MAGPVIVNGIIDRQREAGVEGAAAYRQALLVMVGLLVIGFVANLLVRPVADKHHVSDDTDGRRAAPYPAEPEGASATTPSRSAAADSTSPAGGNR